MMMERRNFLKGTLITTGSVLLGGAVIRRLLNDNELTDSSLPSSIERINLGK